MYKSPIDLIYGEMEIQMEGGMITKAVQKVDVNVDKEELIRALQYDRGQYEKGYKDAMGKQKWIPVTERLPDEDVRVLVWLVADNPSKYTRIDTDRRHDSRWVRWEKYVTHWMPLPEPPEGVWP